MNIDLRGKVIVVTGAGRGLGRALALGLAAQGAHVAVLARRQEQAAQTVQEISRLPGAAAALAVVADVSDESAVARAVATIDRTWGRIDALINNAAWMPPRQYVLETDVETLTRAYSSNVVGSFVTTKHAAPVMIRGGGGRIIYVSSALGVQPNPGLAAYGGTKAALNILSSVVHQELSGQGIRTVALAPGLTDTPGMRESVGEEYIERIASSYPGGRLGSPEDILPLTAFLCSDAADHLSGTLIAVRPPATG
ncbi:SDR family NAD(P)-dependent oxidoreductase [Kitasatospora sp. NPDC052896]|uniref:SDR family NAD(P)-dependent oxidoreductase n=1 Tax=Kitasatospora sp. NPDC052896 TaxID=3364061 RepID=UPI0037CCBEC9